jgi:predicted RNase H-like HicB family nuclease
MQRSYTVIIHRGEDGWWVANVPLLHATTQGRNRSTALKRAKSLIRFALETIQSEGAEPPVEGPSNLDVVRVRAAV